MKEQYRFIQNETGANRKFAYIVFDRIENFTHKMGSSQLLQIYYVTEGEGSFVQINSKKDLQKGDLLIVNPFEESGFETKGANAFSFIGFGIEGKEFKTTVKHDGAMVMKSKNALTHHLLYHIYELMSDGETDTANKYFEAYFDELSKTLSLMDMPTLSSKEEILAKKLKNYLDEHLLEKITISSLAAHFCCSSSSLFHSFKKIEKMTIVEYLQRKRLELAKYFLRTGNRKIADICDDVGFSSTQFFYSYFLKAEGITPNEYRHRHEKEMTKKD